MTPETIIAIDGENSKRILNPKGLRRRVINELLNYGGRARLGDLTDSLGFDPTNVIYQLAHAGWVKETVNQPPPLTRKLPCGG